MKAHIDLVDNYIKNGSRDGIQELIQEHLRKISFFQHERLIHLLVTLFYTLFTIIFFCLIVVSFIFLPIAIILCVFLILYIYHYFYLENGVQYMYKQYDKLKEMEIK